MKLYANYQPKYAKINLRALRSNKLAHSVTDLGFLRGRGRLGGQEFKACKVESEGWGLGEDAASFFPPARWSMGAVRSQRNTGQEAAEASPEGVVAF